MHGIIGSMRLMILKAWSNFLVVGKIFWKNLASFSSDHSFGTLNGFQIRTIGQATNTIYFQYGSFLSPTDQTLPRNILERSYRTPTELMVRDFQETMTMARCQHG